MAEHKLPTNSKLVNKPQKTEERPEVKAIVTSGGATERKKPLGRRMLETFKGEDAQSVGQHIVLDVLVPAAKNAISDAVTQGIERMLFGEVRRGRNPSTGRPGGYTSYSSVSRPSGRAFQPDESTRTISHRARQTHDFREVIVEDRGEAERVLDELGNILDAYDMVTVSDFYTMVNITGNFTDDKYGWNDLRGARVDRVRGGYLINLPPTIPFD